MQVYKDGLCGNGPVSSQIGKDSNDLSVGVIPLLTQHLPVLSRNEWPCKYL